MGLFQDVKNEISTREAAEHYGFQVRRNGMMCCPFHDDRHPSMKVDRNFICFGCQEKGDVIHFVELLFDLSPYEAARKLIEDFGLQISVGDHKKPKCPRRKVMSRWQQEHQFQKAVDRVYCVYCDYLHLLNNWRVRYAPRKSDEHLHPLFVESLRQTSYIEYLLDLLTDGSTEDKAGIVIDHGKGVKELERRIAEFKRADAERIADGHDAVAGRSDRGAGNGAAGNEREGKSQEQSVKLCCRVPARSASAREYSL